MWRFQISNILIGSMYCICTYIQLIISSFLRGSMQVNTPVPLIRHGMQSSLFRDTFHPAEQRAHRSFEVWCHVFGALPIGSRCWSGDAVFVCCCLQLYTSHIIHVWYLYLHSVVFLTYMYRQIIYHIWMLWAFFCSYMSNVGLETSTQTNPTQPIEPTQLINLTNQFNQFGK